jgi:anti-sigma factor RsiW
MACQAWAEKLDAYLDGELSSSDERLLREHLRVCSSCAADSIDRLQMKRAVHNAGQRFQPDPEFRRRLQANLVPQRPSRRFWQLVPALAGLLVVAGVLIAGRQYDRAGRRQLTSEVVDMHVATLASANPLDVVSTDRHTVKPWFAGKIPFTFNLPELEGTPFTLAGGRVAYLRQSPGAELIFRVRQHQISAFIFQERAVEGANPGERDAAGLSFGVRTWSRNGLRYFVIGDASPQNLDQLSELLKAAA